MHTFCWWSISATHSLHYVKNTRVLSPFFPYCQCKPHQIHDYSPSLFHFPPPLWSFDWLLAVKSPIDNDSIQPSWPSSVIDSRFKWLSCSFAIHLPPVPLPLCYLTGNHLPERFVVQSKWCHTKMDKDLHVVDLKFVIFFSFPSFACNVNEGWSETMCHPKSSFTLKLLFFFHVPFIVKWKIAF